VLCGRYTQEERDYRHFLSYFVPEPYPWLGESREQSELDEMWIGEGLIGDMAKYLGVSPSEVISQISDAPQKKVAQAWNDVAPQSTEDVRDFYSRCKENFFDLVMWNVGPSFGHILGQIPDVRGKVVLDFGAGLGSSTMWMLTRGAESIDYLDLPGVLQDFAQWRAREHRVYDSINWINSLDGYEGKYDLIVAIDVLEHLPDLAEWLPKLANCLKDGGVLFCHNEFDKHNGVYPQHYEWGEIWPQLCASSGLEKESQFVWRKL